MAKKDKQASRRRTKKMGFRFLLIFELFGKVVFRNSPLPHIFLRKAEIYKFERPDGARREVAFFGMSKSEKDAMVEFRRLFAS